MSDDNDEEFLTKCKAAYLLVKDQLNNHFTHECELLTALQYFGRNPSHSMVEKLWMDKKGSIGFIDFSHILQNYEQEPSTESLKRMFQKLDLNKSGFVNRNDLVHLISTEDKNLSVSEEILPVLSQYANSDDKIDYNHLIDSILKTTEECKHLALKNLAKFQFKSSASVQESGGHHDLATRSCGITDKILMIRNPIRSQRQDEQGLQKNYAKNIIKGCFVYDQPNLSLVANQYCLEVKTDEPIVIISKIMPTLRDHIDYSAAIRLFLISEDRRSVMQGFITNDDKDLFVTFRLSSGFYTLAPFLFETTFKGEKLATIKKVELMHDDPKTNSIKLTKEARLTLMNIFDMCDADDNGTLNKLEYDLYNFRSSDQHVTDEEWLILTSSFDSRKNELTMKGFVELHQADAKDAQNDENNLNDLWASFLSFGFDYQLRMKQVLPFTIEIRTEDPTKLEWSCLPIQSVYNAMENFYRIAASEIPIFDNLLLYRDICTAVVFAKNETHTEIQVNFKVDKLLNIACSVNSKLDKHLVDVEPLSTQAVISCTARQLAEDWDVTLKFLD